MEIQLGGKIIDDFKEFLIFKNTKEVPISRRYFKKPLDGFFLKAKNLKSKTPILKCCALINKSKNVLNNLILLDDCEVTILEVCLNKMEKQYHKSETIIKLKNSKVRYYAIHNWNNSNVDSISRIILDGSELEYKYICFSSPWKANFSVKVQCNGKFVYEDLIKNKGDFKSKVRVVLNGESKIKSVVFNNKRYKGIFQIEGFSGKGHIDCIGYNRNGRLESVPKLISLNPEVELSHEAKIGKLSDEIKEYLYCRGFHDEEIIEMILESHFGKVEGLNVEEILKYVDKML
jgi:Fe-S cluster assembly scaffold protein SufB